MVSKSFSHSDSYEHSLGSNTSWQASACPVTPRHTCQVGIRLPLEIALLNTPSSDDGVSYLLVTWPLHHALSVTHARRHDPWHSHVMKFCAPLHGCIRQSTDKADQRHQAIHSQSSPPQMWRAPSHLCLSRALDSQERSQLPDAQRQAVRLPTMAHSARLSDAADLSSKRSWHAA